MGGRTLRAAVASVTALSVGCVTVDSFTLRRGELLGKKQVGETVDDRHRVVVSDTDTARVEVDRKTCAQHATEYAQLADQSISYPNPERVAWGMVLMAGGAGGAYLAATRIEDPDSAGGLALSSTMISILGMSIALFAALRKDSDSRVVPAETRETVLSTECADRTFTASESLPFELAVPGMGKRSGVTDPSGRLPLRPVATELLETKVPPLETIRQLARGDSLRYQLQLGKAPLASGTLPASLVPDPAWAGWARKSSEAVEALDALRWASCEDVTTDPKARFGCLWSSERHSGEILTFAGELAPVAGVDHGALGEFRGKAGQRFSYRLALPASSTEWLVQVAELRSGEIIGQRFSGGAARLDFSGTLPRDAEYAVVLNAAGKGSYRSMLTLGGRAPAAETAPAGTGTR